MKKNNFLKVLSFATLFTINSYAQITVDSPEYQQRKAAGTLEGMEVIPAPGGNYTLVNPYTNSNASDFIAKSDNCNCYRDPDGTYTLALSPNDDGSSSLINLPFTFSFYGTNYSSLYINNNGNVTFGNSLSTFSATAFPSASNKIISPFWGDVDTRGGNGRVVYKITPTAIFVNWENVGYYNTQGDKRNSFQLILSNGADPAIPSGANVAFCYKDMQWTTGSASQGVNGFGGVPATAGANKGDNSTYFQLARFNHEGTDFNGALGAPSGVSWLDNKSFFFDITSATNIPPISNGVTPCDTFKICALGDTADFPIIFFSPEANQSTTITVTSTSSSAVSVISNISGNTAYLVVRGVGSLANIGYHTVVVTATDDGIPAGVTTLQFTIWIADDMVNLDPVITPLGACQNATLSVLNGPYDTYLWDNLSPNPTTTVNTAGIQGVTVSRNGCYRRVQANINIMPPIVADLQSGFGICPGGATSLSYIADSAKYSAISWGLADPARDTMFINELLPGTYTLHLVDSAGYCSKDTTFTITSQAPLVVRDDVELCTLTYNFGNQNTGGSNHAVWTFFNSPGTPTFSNATNNPTVTFPTYGDYHLVIKDQFCPDQDTINFKLVQPPYFDFDSDFFACPFETEHLVFKDSTNIKKYHWGIPIVSQDTLFTANLYQGTYTASYEMFQGCTSDTTFTIASQPLTQLHNYNEICGDFVDMTLHVGTTDGLWTVVTMPGTSVPLFGDHTKLNTSIKVTDFGYYEFVFSNECQIKDTLKVNFVPFPYFNLSDVVLCMGDIHEYVVPSPGQNYTYLWSTGATTDKIQVSEEGSYKLVVTNQCGFHADSAYVTVDVCELDFPNVFTPNGDNSNDVFTSLQHPNGFAEFKCTIFNRWGNVMYTYDEVAKSWDGKVNGRLAAEGVYFYKVEAVTKTGKEISKQGFVHLLTK